MRAEHHRQGETAAETLIAAITEAMTEITIVIKIRRQDRAMEIRTEAAEQAGHLQAAEQRLPILR